MDMSHNPINKLTRQLIEYFTVYPEPEDDAPPCFQRYGELLRYHNEKLLELGDLTIAASRINWYCFAQRQGLQLRIESEQLLPDEKSVQELLEASKKWIFPLLSTTKLRKERYALRFQRAPIIAHVLGSILQDGDDYGRYKKPGDPDQSTAPTLRLSLHEQFSDLEIGNTKELHKFRAKQLSLIVRRLLEYANWRIVEADEETEETLHVSVDCNNQPRRISTEELDQQTTVRLVCGPVLEPVKKTATNLTSGSYMA